MKKILFIFFIGLICISLLNAQSLDEALIAAAVKISRDLPADTKAAIISFTSSSEKLNKYVIDELNGNILRNRRVTPVVLDQNQLQSIKNDLRFNEAGNVETQSAQSIGRMLGVAYIITGSLERRIGNEYNLHFNAFDTENAKIQSQYSVALNLRNDQHLSVLLGVTAKLIAKVYDEEKTSNVRKHWLSGGGFLSPPYDGGFSANYEYMLSPNFSIGANLNVGLIYGSGSSISAIGRYYPWGKTFFIGLGLGVGLVGSLYPNIEHTYYDTYSGKIITEHTLSSVFGFLFTPSVGWKIDIGAPGGFFLQPGIRMPIGFGNKHPLYYYEDDVYKKEFGVNVSIGIFFTIGGAFGK